MSMLVRFSTDASVTAAGWSANYTSLYCSSQSTLGAYNGTFSDGSGASNYLDYTTCRWLIPNPTTNATLLSFTAFDVEDGYDFVRGNFFFFFSFFRNTKSMQVYDG